MAWLLKNRLSKNFENNKKLYFNKKILFKFTSWLVLVKLYVLLKHLTILLLVGVRTAMFGTVVCTFVVPRVREVCSNLEGAADDEDVVPPFDDILILS